VDHGVVANEDGGGARIQVGGLEAEALTIVGDRDGECTGRAGMVS
jgi:hypothetical protein